MGIVKTLKRIADSLEIIAMVLRNGVVSVKDLGAVNIYSQHLGEKLRSANAEEPQPVKET